MSVKNVRTSAGSFLLVSPTRPVTYDAAGFQALPWTEVAEITDLGEFGREYSQVTHAPLATRRTIKRRGGFNDGSITLPMARDAEDAGQALMAEALDSDDSYSYCIQVQDGSRFYFTAQCMSFKTSIGGVDSITGKTAQLEIDDDIIEVSGVSFALTYTADANGSIVGDTPQSVLQGGMGKPVFAQAAAGYRFLKWSDNSVANPRADGPIVAALNLTAQFELT